MTVFSVDKFKIGHERKRGGTSKEEESHAIAPGRNKGRG
jgi:hypothetical protein